MRVRSAAVLIFLATAFGIPSGHGLIVPNRGGWGRYWNSWYVPAGPSQVGTGSANLDGQIICQYERPSPRNLPFYHSGDRYGWKYAGTYCIGPTN